MKYFLLFITVLTASVLYGQQPIKRNPKITFYHKRAMTSIKPDYRKLVANTSSHFTNHTLNTDSLKAALRKNSMLANLTNTDIETLIVLVMLETSEQMDAELRTLAAEMKAQNSSRKNQRDATLAKDSSRATAGRPGDKDSMQELTEEKMFRIRQVTEARERLERMITNIMEKSGATEDNISENLKG
ncbi:MAG: hypothetical protein EOO09_13895 [Chitinophagaceae bacterium]|nr:MAG: hypothetical protein EOO09_13895 [Chitinophagaceae bacterium]